MRTYRLDIVPFHSIQHSRPDFAQVCHGAVALPQVLNIHGDFTCVVCALHKVTFIYEHVTIDEAGALVYISGLVNHRPAYIID